MQQHREQAPQPRYKRTSSDIGEAASRAARWFEAREAYKHNNPTNYELTEILSDPDGPYKYLDAVKKQGIWERAREPMIDVFRDFRRYISKNPSSDEWGDPMQTELFLKRYPHLDPEIAKEVRRYAVHLYDLNLHHPVSEAIEVSEASAQLLPSPVEPRIEDDPAKIMEETRRVPVSQILTEPDGVIEEAQPQEVDNLGTYINKIDTDFSHDGKLSATTDSDIQNSTLPLEEKAFLFEYIQLKTQSIGTVHPRHKSQ